LHEVVALSELAILVTALDDDRHSYAKERRHEQADQNIVNVLRHTGFTVEQAAEAAVRIRDRIPCRFLRIRNRVSTPARNCAATWTIWGRAAPQRDMGSARGALPQLDRRAAHRRCVRPRHFRDADHRRRPPLAGFEVKAARTVFDLGGPRDGGQS
jgi:terpene synthase-like protein